MGLLSRAGRAGANALQYVGNQMERVPGLRGVGGSFVDQADELAHASGGRLGPAWMHTFSREGSQAQQMADDLLRLAKVDQKQAARQLDLLESEDPQTYTKVLQLLGRGGQYSGF